MIWFILLTIYIASAYYMREILIEEFEEDNEIPCFRQLIILICPILNTWALVWYIFNEYDLLQKFLNMFFRIKDKE